MKKIFDFNIIIPVFNEDEVIEDFNDNLQKVLNEIDFKFKIIYVNDGSRDQTENILNKLSNKNTFIEVINFTRNFGSHSAILAGLSNYREKPSIVMSCDFQDPPILIKELINKYIQNKKIVYALRSKRKDPFFKNLFANLFYKFTRLLGINYFPKNGNDGFGLYPKVIKNYLRLVETIEFLLF